MKRIQYTCLNQIIHFQLKECVDHDLTVSEVKEEYEKYKKNLERKRTKYKIVDERIKNDGSILIKVKRQVKNYDVGNYLD